MIKVFGHKSPDTDATCAPIAYAWYLKQKGIDAEAYVLGELNKETEFILKTANINTPKILEDLADGDEVVIVDTNNPEELPENINKTKILNIVDHHKLAGLTTDSPLDIFMKPVGSSSTLVYQRINWENLTPTTEIATLLLGAILSDTLKFTSPTTTDEDKLAAEELAKIADINVDNLASEMFAAKSDLTGMSARDVLYMDSKVFDFGSKKVRISCLETTKPENAKMMIEGIKTEMGNIKNEENIDAVFFFIVNILDTASELVVASDVDKKTATLAFEKEFDGEYLILPGVVSRKKQIVPAFEKVLS